MIYPKFRSFALLLIASATTTMESAAQTVRDIDGNTYDVISIGSQKWLKQNLRVRHYNNGDPLLHVVDPLLWASVTRGHYTYYNNDSTSNALVFGALYNWSAVNDSRGLCPEGCRVPTNSEWNQMEIFLDPTVDTVNGDWVGTTIGGILKDTGTRYWASPNAGATNSVGFTGLPGGYRDNAGDFLVGGFDGGWWTSTRTVDTNWVFGRGLDYNTAQINHNRSFGLSGGFAVRCICELSNTGYSAPRSQSFIKIYPNPTSRKLFVEGLGQNGAILYLFDMQGRLILQKNVAGNQAEIEVGFLPKGLYLLKVPSVSSNQLNRIIIE